MNSIDHMEVEDLFEDPYLLIVHKPAGMPVQPDLTGHRSLQEVLSARFPLRPPVLVNRLDRPVSGAVLFAYDEQALAAMNKAFRERTVDKVYWAIVEGRMGSSVLHHHTVHDKRSFKSRIVSGKDGDRELVLHVRSLADGDRYTLVELRPEGGAFHQIRAQLGASGHPIKGDVKYGARRGEKDRSIALHARSLGFVHPLTHRAVLAQAPAPRSPLWRTLLDAAEEGRTEHVAGSRNDTRIFSGDPDRLSPGSDPP